MHPARSLVSCLAFATLVACGSSGGDDSTTPPDDTGGDDSTVGDTARSDSGTDSAKVDTATADSALTDTNAADTNVADSGTDTTPPADSATDVAVDVAVDAADARDTSVVDSTADATADTATPDVADVSDTPDVATSFACGAAPRITLNPSVLAIGATPPFENITSTVCASGVFLPVAMTPSSGSSSGRGVMSVEQVAQFLSATASDGTAFLANTGEFIPNATSTTGLFPIVTYSKALSATLLPPGFTATSGKALLNIVLGKKSTTAAPCNATDGVTIALDSASATAHPEAVIYYDTGSGWSTTGPSTSGHTGVVIVLTPASATDYVQFVGTKSGCTVDTGLTSAGQVRALGYTGRGPLAANTITTMAANITL